MVAERSGGVEQGDAVAIEVTRKGPLAVFSISG